MKDKIVQVNGFPWVDNQNSGYLLVGVTESGDVVMSQGDGKWASVGPEKPKFNLDHDLHIDKIDVTGKKSNLEILINMILESSEITIRVEEPGLSVERPFNEIVCDARSNKLSFVHNGGNYEL